MLLPHINILCAEKWRFGLHNLTRKPTNTVHVPELNYKKNYKCVEITIYRKTINYHFFGIRLKALLF